MIELAAENEKLRKEVDRLSKENEILRQKIDALARKMFGKSSEQIDENQLQLLLEGMEEKKPEPDDQDESEEETAPSQEPVKRRKKRKSRKATLPDDLPTEEVVIIPEEVQKNPELYREIDEEVTEKLDYDPAQFRRVIYKRKKFVKKAQRLDDPESDRFFIAPLPASIKEKSLLTPRLAAEIATNRFCYHLPYYRLEQMFLIRHGVHLPRNTMSQWMGDLAHDYLAGIYTAMHENLLRETYLQGDETPIDYQPSGSEEKGTKKGTKKGYLWAISKPDLNATDGRGDILYQWHTGRSHECLTDLLSTPNQNFMGILQCDGYSAYESYEGKTVGIELAGCWAHVRRKFYEARAYKPKISIWIIKHIQNLYAIEAKLRERRASAAERERVRQVESLPIYRRLEKGLKMLEEKRKVLPQSNLGKAISYALGQWSKLERCFLDGRMEIDNNLIENGIRPTKLGAKNWLFMGSEAAGQTNAIWYTVVESCRRRKLDPWKYLVWIFTELPQVKVEKDTFANYTPEGYSRSYRKVKKRA